MPKVSKLNYLFLFSVLALAAVGLIMIFSASPTLALKHGDTFYYLKRQLFYMLLGAGALWYGFKIDLEILRRRAIALYALSIMMLLLVFIPGVGRSVLGASRWIDLGLIAFQPSELIKFTSVLFLAKWLSENQKKLSNLFTGFLPPVLGFGLVSLIIMKQPDLGTSITIGATMIVMLFLAGADWRHLLGLAGLGIAGALFLSVTSAYRFRRLLAFIDPWKDPQGIGFHIIQSLLAVGSGGLFGLGLGASRQKFFYLPQQFTDFIFAILCEETGLVGGLGVLSLFFVFLWQGFKIASATRDQFKKMLAAGLVCWVIIQALINIMVVVGLIPTTGIPLPLISYGGTATIVTFFAAGVVLNISRQAV